MPIDPGGVKLLSRESESFRFFFSPDKAIVHFTSKFEKKTSSFLQYLHCTIHASARNATQNVCKYKPN